MEIDRLTPGATETQNPKKGRTAVVELVVEQLATPKTPPTPIVAVKPRVHKKRQTKASKAAVAAAVKAPAAPPITATDLATNAQFSVLDFKSMVSEVMAAVPAAVVAAVVPISSSMNRHEAHVAVPVVATAEQSTRIDDFEFQNKLLDMQFKNKKREAEMKALENEATHKNRMEEWAMIMKNTGSREEGRKRNADERNGMEPDPALKAMKMESPISKLNLGKSLRLCREWLHANGGASMDEVLKPCQVVDQCFELMEDPHLQEQLNFATSVTIKLNYVVDVFFEQDC